MHASTGNTLLPRLRRRSLARTLGAASILAAFAGAPAAYAFGGTGELSLETTDCPVDADPIEPGYQIEVELWMRNLSTAATGFQAFTTYDTGVLTYRADLSSYTATPFPVHIRPITLAEVAAGALWLDGFDFTMGGSAADALLATLVFDVAGDCASTVPTAFDLLQPFASELSADGVPLTTTLTDAGAITIDTVAPVLDPCPADITVPADANIGDGCQGAIVTYTAPGATDACDASPTIVCTPASGSEFPVGTTTVTCTATDDCGNESSCTFDVIVTPTNAVDVTVELAGVNVAVSRCINFILDACGSTADVTLSFFDHDGDDANGDGIVDGTEGMGDLPSTPVQASDLIEVPCGTWASLCAKDEQHTLTDTSSLSVLGTVYVTDVTVSLRPGDTDNDDDVDVNDVTLLIAQFGNMALDGGCAWDGTRDADFSNNGVVGSEDFSLLSDNWLELSSCGCSGALTFGGDGFETSILSNRVSRDVAQKVDLDADGVIDFRDIALFERAHGLSDTLSTKLLLADQIRRR